MKKIQSSKIARSQKAIVFSVAIIVLVGVMSFFPGQWGQAHTFKNCTSLSLSQGSFSGAAGTIYKNAVITNTGSKTCTITGYPGVFMQDGNGRQVGSGAAANSLYPVSPVVLAPGSQAHTVVAFAQQANFPPGTCSSIGSAMKVYVPGISSPLVAPWSGYSCPSFSATAIRAGAE